MTNEQPSTVPPHVRRRWDVFLKVFRETGSVAAACAAASPHLDHAPSAQASGHGPAYRTFNDWLRKYPELAVEFEEARYHALGLVEKALAERSMTPERVPVFSRGNLMGWREVWRDANALLLRRAARLDPEAWAPKQQSDVRIEHVNAGDGFTVALTAADVLLLPPEKRALFVEMLTLIRDKKENTRELIDAEPTTRPTLSARRADEEADSDGGGADPHRGASGERGRDTGGG